MAMSMFVRDRLLSKSLCLLLVTVSPVVVESVLPRTGPVAGFLSSGVQIAQPSDGVGTCSPLNNQGTFSTVVLGVGEPSQRLEVIADTGSSAVIVASCQCQSCNSNECYNKDRSSSAAENPEFEGKVVSMLFGSGVIDASVVTDTVKIGATSHLMTDGVLEMLEQKLDFSTDFEGLLGLGPPAEVNPLEEYHEKNFLAEAGVGHFSFCLSDDAGGSGVLHLGGPDGAAAKLGSRGKMHWALGMNGISVGDGASSNLQFCSPFDMKSGQVTPCGAIPDSGTTMISGPANQVLELFDGICDGWPRCVAAHQNSRRMDTAHRKAMTFKSLLMKCQEWIHEAAGLEELPTLHFHLTGSDNTEVPIALSPQSYIIEMQRDLYESHFQELLDVPVPDAFTGEMCAPAFGASSMDTNENGPVWILGTSFFYEYVIHYSLHPQSIAFEQASCGECLSDGTVQPGQEFFMTEGGGVGGVGANGTRGRRAVRRLSTAPRQPDRYNTQHGQL